MNILIFGGTTEGRMLAQAISELHKDRVTVSVATSVGAHELAGIDGIKVIVGRLDEEEMVRLFIQRGSDGENDNRPDTHVPYDLVVDATHPYAVEVSANIRSAAARTGVRCVRLVRTDNDGEIRGGLMQDSDAVYVDSYFSQPGRRNWVLFARFRPTGSMSVCCRRRQVLRPASRQESLIAI